MAIKTIGGVLSGLQNWSDSAPGESYAELSFELAETVNVTLELAEEPRAWPTTAAIMNTAIGGGTWSHGWDFDDASGTTFTALYGATNLTLSTATNMTYANTGIAPSWSSTAVAGAGYTGTITASGVWTTSSRCAYARFYANAQAHNTTLINRNIFGCSDWGVGVNATGRLVFGTDEMPGTGTGPADWSSSSSHWFSDFLYDDGLPHSVLVWFTLTAGQKKAHILTDMEYKELWIRDAWAPTNVNFYVGGQSLGGISSVGIGIQYAAIGTSATGLSSTSIRTFEAWLDGVGLPAVKTAWPTPAELNELFGLSESTVYRFDELSLPFAAETGSAVDCDFTTETVATDGFADYENGALFAGAGGVMIKATKLTTDSTFVRPTTASPTFTMGIVMDLWGMHNASGPHRDLMWGYTSANGVILTEYNTGRNAFYYWGSSAGIANNTQSYGTPGLTTYIGANVSATSRFGTGPSGTYSNATNVGTMTGGTTTLNIGQSAPSTDGGLTAGEGVDPLRAIQYAFWSNDEGNLTSTANVHLAKCNLQNWMRGATKSPRQQFPHSGWSYRTACGLPSSSGAESCRVTAFDDDDDWLSFPMDTLATPAVSMAPATGQSAAAAYVNSADRFIAQRHGIKMTSTTGYRSSTTLLFGRYKLLHFMFRCTEAPVANRHLVYITSDATPTFCPVEAYVDTSGHLNITVRTSTGNATGTISQDFCDGEWHNVMIWTRSSPISGISEALVSTDLADLTVTSSAGNSWNSDASSRIIIGTSETGGMGYTALTCDLGYLVYNDGLIASATSSSFHPRPHLKNFLDFFGKTYSI